MGIDTLTPSVSGAFASDFGDDIVHPNKDEGTHRHAHAHPLPKNASQSQSQSKHRRASSHTFSAKDGVASSTHKRHPRQHTYQRSNSFNFPLPFTMSSPPPLSPSAADGHSKLFGHVPRRRDSRKSSRARTQQEHERLVLEELRSIRTTQQRMSECMVALQRSHSRIKGDLHHLRLNLEGLHMEVPKSAAQATTASAKSMLSIQENMATDSAVAAAAAALSMQSVEAPHQISDVFERNIDCLMRMLKGE